MSEATEAPKGKRKTDEAPDPDQFMNAAREQLQKQREEVLQRQAAINEELATIDGKLERIEAYFNPPPATREPVARKPRTTSGTRKPRQSGVRDGVLAEIAKHPDGISRKDLLAAMSATTKGQEQSVSNAVAALKKDGKITDPAKGIYKAV